MQVVRATDITDRTTTSTSYVDANISVTITPQQLTSSIIVIYSYLIRFPNNSGSYIQITDSSNIPLSGAENAFVRDSAGSNGRLVQTLLGYVTPETASAVTYKGRFKSLSGDSFLLNSENTGQMYAIEVAA